MRQWPGVGMVVVLKAMFAWLLLVCSCWMPSSQGAGATSSLEAPERGGCLPQDCGLNGAWLGQEVPFRTLYIPRPFGTGQANAQQLKIISFKKDLTSLNLDLETDELVGVIPSHQKLNGAALQGAVLTIQGPGLKKWYLKIIEVLNVEFWTACATSNPSDACQAARAFTPAYKFSVTTDFDNRPSTLCQPGLAGGGNLEGTAVMFRGDSYNEATFEVSNVQDSSFNIACYGTALSKLHLLRHTAAAMGAFAFPVARRQAVLRMLTGDYCGDGHSLTNQGHAIRIGFGNSSFQPQFQDVGLDAAQSLDAMWKGDGTGASCIGTPRLSDDPAPASPESVEQRISEIEEDCQANGRPVPPPCDLSRWEAVQSGDTGADYLGSANLFLAP